MIRLLQKQGSASSFCKCSRRSGFPSGPPDSLGIDNATQLRFDGVVEAAGTVRVLVLNVMSEGIGFISRNGLMDEFAVVQTPFLQDATEGEDKLEAAW